MLYQINNALLLFGVSFYMGTGWSTWIFNFPVIPKLTTADYYNHFIPQIAAATDFFTFLVSMMILTGAIMIVGEWNTKFRWVPIVVVACVIGATCLTVFIIFPGMQQSFRAVTVMGSTGRVRGYRWNGRSWMEA